MKKNIGKIAAIGISFGATVILCVILFAHAVPSCSQSAYISATFYYVCYDSPTDSMSAASVSSVVHSYGGAGYIIENGGDYYVTVSCYYEEEDANAVVKNLAAKGLKCRVVAAKRENCALPPSAKGKAAGYRGVFNTLFSLSQVCYDLANAMDGGERDGSAAKSVLSEVRMGLSGLLKANPDNCFSEELSALIAECDDASGGYVFSYDVRRLQIAICDCIVHVRLY